MRETIAKTVGKHAEQAEHAHTESAFTSEGGAWRAKTAHFCRELDRVVGVLDSQVRDSTDELWSLVQAAVEAGGDGRRESRNRAFHAECVLFGRC